MAISSKTARLKSQAGFTLMEGMIAGGLLAVTAVAVSSVMGTLQGNLVTTQIMGNRDIIMDDVVRSARSSMALNNSVGADANLGACLTGGLCNPAKTPFMLSTPFTTGDWIGGSYTTATDPDQNNFSHSVTFDSNGRKCQDPQDINCIFMVQTWYTAGCSNQNPAGPPPNGGMCPIGAEYIRIDFEITYSKPNALNTQMSVVSITDGHALDNVQNLGTEGGGGPSPSPSPVPQALAIMQIGMQDSSGNFPPPPGGSYFNQAQIIASTPTVQDPTEAQNDAAALVFPAGGTAYAYEGQGTWPYSGPDSGQYGYQNPLRGSGVQYYDTCWPKYVMNQDGTFTTTLNTTRVWPGDPNDPNSPNDGEAWTWNPAGSVPVPVHSPQDSNDNSPGSTNNLLVEIDLAAPITSQTNVTLFRYVYLPYCGFDHYSFNFNQTTQTTWQDGVDLGYDDYESSSYCGLDSGFGSANPSWSGWDQIATIFIPAPPSNTTSVAYICEIPTLQSGRQSYTPVGLVTGNNSSVGSSYAAEVIMKRAPEVQIDFADPYTTYGSTQFPSAASTGGTYTKTCDPTFAYGASGTGGTPGFTVWDDIGLASVQGLTDPNLPSVVTYNMDTHNTNHTRRDYINIPEQAVNLTSADLTIGQGWTVSFGVTDLIGQVAAPVSESVTVNGAGTSEAIRIGTGMGSGDGSNRYNAQEIVQSTWNSSTTPTATCQNTDANVTTCMPNVATPLGSNLILESEFRLHCNEFNGTYPDVLLNWWTYDVTQSQALGSQNSPNLSIPPPNNFTYSPIDYNLSNDCNGQALGPGVCAPNSNPCVPIPLELMGDSPTSVYWDFTGQGLDMDYFLCYNHTPGDQLACADWLGEPTQCASTPPLLNNPALGDISYNSHTGPDAVGGNGDIIAATAGIYQAGGVSDNVAPDTTLFKIGNILAWFANDDVYWLTNSTTSGGSIVHSASSKFNLKVMTGAPFQDDVTFDVTDQTTGKYYQVTVNAGDQQNDDAGGGTTIQSLWNPASVASGSIAHHNFYLTVDPNISYDYVDSFVISPVQTTTYTPAVDNIEQRGNFWMTYDAKNPMADACPNGTTAHYMQTSTETTPPSYGWNSPWVSDWTSNDSVVYQNMHYSSDYTTAAGQDNFQSLTTGLDTQMQPSNPMYFNPTVTNGSAKYYAYMIGKKTSSSPTQCSSFPNGSGGGVDVEWQCACLVGGYGASNPCPSDLLASGDSYQTTDVLLYFSWVNNSTHIASGQIFDFGSMLGLRQPYLITDTGQQLTGTADAIGGAYSISTLVPYGSLEVNQILLKVCE